MDKAAAAAYLRTWAGGREWSDGEDGEILRKAADVLDPVTDPRREAVHEAIVDVFNNRWHFPGGAVNALTDAVLAALEEPAAPTAPGTRYRDRDGDVWEIAADGVPLWVEHDDGSPVREAFQRGASTRTLARLEDEYGPLTRI